MIGPQIASFNNRFKQTTIQKDPSQNIENSSRVHLKEGGLLIVTQKSRENQKLLLVPSKPSTDHQLHSLFRPLKT